MRTLSRRTDSRFPETSNSQLLHMPMVPLPLFMSSQKNIQALRLRHSVLSLAYRIYGTQVPRRGLKGKPKAQHRHNEVASREEALHEAATGGDIEGMEGMEDVVEAEAEVGEGGGDLRASKTNTGRLQYLILQLNENSWLGWLAAPFAS